MTESPVSVPASATIDEAGIIMQEQGVRHLPVVEAGHLVGVLSDRDLVRSFGSKYSALTRVEEVMTKDPFHVTPETDLLKMLEIMSHNKIGCAVVKNQGGQVVGIFTSTDAIELLCKLLHRY